MTTRTKTESFCPACGASTQGATSAAKCETCGKLLKEGYFPLDNLRASYGSKQTWVKRPEPETETLFEENKNGASETAWAFAVYSMVPYLGILFCPGAVLMGGVGLVVSQRNPDLGGGRISAFSIAGGFLIFGFQILLWWLLYYIPTLERHI